MARNNNLYNQAYDDFSPIFAPRGRAGIRDCAPAPDYSTSKSSPPPAPAPYYAPDYAPTVVCTPTPTVGGYCSIPAPMPRPMACSGNFNCDRNMPGPAYYQPPPAPYYAPTAICTPTPRVGGYCSIPAPMPRPMPCFTDPELTYNPPSPPNYAPTFTNTSRVMPMPCGNGYCTATPGMIGYGQGSFGSCQTPPPPPKAPCSPPLTYRKGGSVKMKRGGAVPMSKPAGKNYVDKDGCINLGSGRVSTVTKNKKNSNW